MCLCTSMCGTGLLLMWIIFITVIQKIITQPYNFTNIPSSVFYMLTKLGVTPFFTGVNSGNFDRQVSTRRFQLSLTFILSREGGWRGDGQRSFPSSQFPIFNYGFSALQSLHWATLQQIKKCSVFFSTLLRFAKSLMRIRHSFPVKVSLNQIPKSSVWLWTNCLTIKHPHALLRGNSESSLQEHDQVLQAEVSNLLFQCFPCIKDICLSMCICQYTCLLKQKSTSLLKQCYSKIPAFPFPKSY